jgi:hypothetical protein
VYRSVVVKSQSPHLFAIKLISPRDLITTTASNEIADFAKLVDASATTGANLTLAMGETKLAAAVVKLSGLCFISEMIEQRPLVCCSCVARAEYRWTGH